MADNRFNLIDEPWIPVVGKGKVGLRQIFADNSIVALGGNPVEKIAVFKLLLAIAQSAYTPNDENDWESLGVDGLQKKVAEYLNAHYDCFWLYGEKPFLQMPILKEKAGSLSKKENRLPSKIGSGNFADLMAENNTFVSQYDFKDISEDDACKALFLIVVLNFAFYGKQPNQDISLSSLKKGPIAKPGPSLGFPNYLHTFGLCESVIDSLYFNLISLEQLNSYTWLPNGIGLAFWEKMPSSENDQIALDSKKTLLGHLVPLSRFVLLEKSGLYFTEGIIYHLAKSEKKSGKNIENWIELSMSWYLEKDDVKALTADVSKKPWRSLTSILSIPNVEKKYMNIGLNLFLSRSLRSRMIFSIWSGGIDVSGDSFGKKVKNNDDYVESEVQLDSSCYNDSFCINLFNEMEYLNRSSLVLKESIVGYFCECRDAKSSKNLKMKILIEKQYTPNAVYDYWQLCEKEFQHIVDVCLEPDTDLYKEKMSKIDARIQQFVEQVYNQYCPNQSARQLETWAKNFPRKIVKKGA